MKRFLKVIAAVILMTAVVWAVGYSIPSNPNINDGMESNESQNGNNYVDLGLPSGTLWATYNIGATKPEEKGDYFAWGETYPKEEYTWENYQHGNMIRHNGQCIYVLNKYCNKGEYNIFNIDNLTMLQPCDDAATVSWGNGWYIPSKAQWEELIRRTTQKPETRKGVPGVLFTANNGKSLFLPNTCYRWDKGQNGCSSCYYWSSSLDTNAPYNAWRYEFCSSYENKNGVSNIYFDRSYGFAVRAVRSAK